MVEERGPTLGGGGGEAGGAVAAGVVLLDERDVLGGPVEHLARPIDTGHPARRQVEGAGDLEEALEREPDLRGGEAAPAVALGELGVLRALALDAFRVGGRRGSAVGEIRDDGASPEFGGGGRLVRGGHAGDDFAPSVESVPLHRRTREAIQMRTQPMANTARPTWFNSIGESGSRIGPRHLVDWLI